jgi:hypothetical protein
MTVLQNYVELESGVPARMHFENATIVRKTITDPVTLQPASRNTLVFDVDTLDGRPVVSKYSIMAEKLANQFEPYLKDQSYLDYDFIITVTGEGFRRQFQVQVIPRT